MKGHKKQMTTEKNLNQRAKTHGDFSEFAITARLLKGNVALRLKQNQKALNDTQSEALDMILHKIARIINGNPNEIDHWRDIAGYAELVVRELERHNTQNWSIIKE